MSEYIKVDDVRSHLLYLANDFEKNDQYYPGKHLKEKAKTLRMLSEKFYDYPSNIEVVRCKDCKYLKEIDPDNLYVCERIDIGMDGEPNFLKPETDFCSCGERKETE